MAGFEVSPEEPERMQSENFFDLTHGQPFLRQPVPSFFKWSARCRWWSSVLCFGGLFYSGRMPIVIPGSDTFLSPSARNPYRHRPGILIAIERNMHSQSMDGLNREFGDPVPKRASVAGEVEIPPTA